MDLASLNQLPTGSIPLFEIPNMSANAVYYHSEDFAANNLDLNSYQVVWAIVITVVNSFCGGQKL
ncbi:MAG: hypothetical protein LRZ88_11610 [Candidatus Cloacimonetes bacterium]|nr:hypothetical protein [Candidatus Cloacimonadota bacterium]